MKLDLVNEFTTRTAQLEVEEFVGLARLLNVPLSTDTDARDHRPFEDVFIDVVTAYGKLGRSQKRDLIKVLRRVEKENRVLKEEVTSNAGNPSNPTP